MNYKVLIFILFISMFLMACQPTEPWSNKDDIVLVEVDGKPVTLPMLEFMMENKGVSADDTEGMREILDDLIRLRVVATAAETEGLAEQKSIRAERAIKDMEVLQLAYFSQAYKQFPIADEQIEETYRLQVDRAGEFQYQLQTVEYADQAQAISAIVGMADGSANFESLIEEANEERRSVQVTSWVDLSQVPERVRTSMRGAEIGDTLELPLPNPLNQTWLVAQVVDRRNTVSPPLEQVREGIARALVRQRLEALVEDLYDAAQIEAVHEADSAAQSEPVSNN